MLPPSDRQFLSIGCARAFGLSQKSFLDRGPSGRRVHKGKTRGAPRGWRFVEAPSGFLLSRSSSRREGSGVCFLRHRRFSLTGGDREKQSENRENKPPPNLTSDLSVEYVAQVRQEVTPARPRKAERLCGNAREGTNFGLESLSQRTPRGYELVSQLSRGFLVASPTLLTNLIRVIRFSYSRGYDVGDTFSQ